MSLEQFLLKRVHSVNGKSSALLILYGQKYRNIGNIAKTEALVVVLLMEKTTKTVNKATGRNSPINDKQSVVATPTLRKLRVFCLQKSKQN